MKRRRSEDSWFSIEEFAASGLLQEVNRQFFHPLGLALAVGHDDETDEWKLVGILDGRDDPEGFEFRDLTPAQADRGRAIVAEQERRLAIRRERLGFGVEPLPEGRDAAD
jgi:hypothetical protein